MCDEQINPCALGADDCHSNAECSHMGPGTFSCACEAGYDGDGQTCSDIDECASSPCQNGGTCLESTVQSSATCVETVSGVDAVDTAACAGVSGSDLDDATACLAILTNSGADAVDLAACTYTAAVAVDEYVCQCVSGWDGSECWSFIVAATEVRCPLPPRVGGRPFCGPPGGLGDRDTWEPRGLRLETQNAVLA